MRVAQRPEREVEGRAKKRLRAEDKLWYRIARATGTSVAKAKCETSAREFYIWSHLFDEEWNQREKWEHYAAEIRYQLHLLYVAFLSDPPQELLDKTVKDFYCTFVVNNATGGAKRIRPDAANDPSFQMMKMGILFSVGLNPDGSMPESPDGKRKLPTRKAPDQKRK